MHSQHIRFIREEPALQIYQLRTEPFIVPAEDSKAASDATVGVQSLVLAAFSLGAGVPSSVRARSPASRGPGAVGASLIYQAGCAAECGPRPQWGIRRHCPPRQNVMAPPLYIPRGAAATNYCKQ